MRSATDPASPLRIPSSSAVRYIGIQSFCRAGYRLGLFEYFGRWNPSFLALVLDTETFINKTRYGSLSSMETSDTCIPRWKA